MRILALSIVLLFPSLLVAGNTPGKGKGKHPWKNRVAKYFKKFGGKPLPSKPLTSSLQARLQHKIALPKKVPNKTALTLAAKQGTLKPKLVAGLVQLVGGTAVRFGDKAQGAIAVIAAGIPAKAVLAGTLNSDGTSDFFVVDVSELKAEWDLFTKSQFVKVSELKRVLDSAENDGHGTIVLVAENASQDSLRELGQIFRLW